MRRWLISSALGGAVLFGLLGPACSSSPEVAPLHASGAGSGGKNTGGGGIGGAPDAASDATNDALGGSAGVDASLDASDGEAEAEGDASDLDSGDSAVEDAVAYDAYPVDGSACGAVEENHPIDDSSHVPVCSDVSYSSNPPASGHHYPIWAAYTIYSDVVPRGFWVHNLEHGGVVITYNCPSGCAGEVAAAEAMIAALPEDPLCPEGGGPLRRVVMTPDPLLDVKWAASAWGWTLKANCFEASAFSAFYLAHHGHAPEDFCGDGEYIGDGGLIPPNDCGDGGVTDASAD